MTTEQNEILDATWSGAHHGSAHTAAVACLLDVLTGGGAWSAEHALQDAEREGRARILTEIDAQWRMNRQQLDALGAAWDDAIDTLRVEAAAG